MQASTRCPRCGYVLRFDGRSFSCDFCGYPRTRNSVTDTLQGMERNLRFKVQGLVDTMKRSLSRGAYVYYPVAVQPCISCGVNLLIGTLRCPRCGMAQEAARRPFVSAQPDASQSIDGVVLDYIIANQGTISFSQASHELRMPQDILQSAIERLKAAGFLSQT